MLTKEAFAGQVDTLFQVLAPSGDWLDFRLDEVRIGRATPRQEQFSLFFTGSPPLLKQGIYAFRQAVIGSFDLFIVPVGEKNGGESFIYQAVFNRILPEEQK